MNKFIQGLQIRSRRTGDGDSWVSLVTTDECFIPVDDISSVHTKEVEGHSHCYSFVMKQPNPFNNNLIRIDAKLSRPLQDILSDLNVMVGR